MAQLDLEEYLSRIIADNGYYVWGNKASALGADSESRRLRFS